MYNYLVLTLSLHKSVKGKLHTFVFLINFIIYLNLCYHENQKSISSYIPELTIKGSSVSKDLACGGYRLGWCAFPKELESLFLECCSCASRVYSCTATPIQYATADMLLKDEECDKYVNEMITLFRHIKTQLLPLLKNTKLKYADVDAAWYVYINFENYKKELMNIGIKKSITLLLLTLILFPFATLQNALSIICK